jgi:hexosaminidase
VEVRQAYDWDPADHLDGVTEDDILGVEAALWTETLASWPDLTYMTLPRLPGIAEVGWSAATRDWPGYAARLASHGPRWAAAGLSFYASPEIGWVRGGGRGATPAR